MLPDDIARLNRVSSVSLLPDGSAAVISVSRPHLDHDRSTSALWLVDLHGAGVHRLTRGPADTAPVVSPDGTRVAFLRAVEEGKPQIALLSLLGGEPVVLSDHPLGASEPRWSPDGGRLLYTARVPEPGRYGTAQDVGPRAEPPRLIRTNRYRHDSVGYTRDRRPHVFVLDLTTLDDDGPGHDVLVTPLQPLALTDSDVDDAAPAWSPDGSLVAFISARHDGCENDLRRGAYVVPAGGGPVRHVVGGDLAAQDVAWVDDTTVVLLGHELDAAGRDGIGRPFGLFVAEIATGGERPTPATRISGLDDDLGEHGDRVRLAGGRVLVRRRRRGTVELVSADPRSIAPQQLSTISHGQHVVQAFDATSDGTSVVAVVSDPERAGDLAVVSEGQPPRMLTDLTTSLRAEAALRPVRELELNAPDGYPVHGWVVLPDPDRFGPGPHPVLLNVHGGPFAAYNWGLFDEAQVYAGAGYAVLMANPRGSAGYGEQHARVILGSLGTVDADDVLAFLDGALADPELPLDRDRVGVMGGSYGGYMAALLTTRTDRFAAAIVERGYLDAPTFMGSSDIGWMFAEDLHRGAAAMREQSPMTYADQVRTPTLVIHSEEDWRCPVDQGQRWFAALHSRGIEAELLLFPGEGHDLTRTGRPQHRVARFEHIVRWWARHLPVQPHAR